jgi:hypothetical protein
MNGLRGHVRNNFIGYIALFVALAGVPTAWAVATNSVGSKQLKPKAVKTSDIADSAVTSPKVADGSLLAHDFASGQLPAGAQGPQGAQGVPGTPGTPFRAMALVAGDATTPAFLTEVPEVGFESVTRDEAGVFCITPSAGIDPASDPPFITVEYNYSSGENFTVMWDVASSNCGSGKYEIKTYKADTNAAIDNVAFAIMVP